MAPRPFNHAIGVAQICYWYVVSGSSESCIRMGHQGSKKTLAKCNGGKRARANAFEVKIHSCRILRWPEWHVADDNRNDSVGRKITPVIPSCAECWNFPLSFLV